MLVNQPFLSPRSSPSNESYSRQRPAPMSAQLCPKKQDTTPRCPSETHVVVHPQTQPFPGLLAHLGTSRSVSSWAQQHVDCGALIHRAILFSNLLHLKRQIEHFGWINLPLPHKLKIGQAPSHRNQTAMRSGYELPRDDSLTSS